MPISAINKQIWLTLALSTCFILPGAAFAATYWVSPTGTASWANCQSTTPLSGTAACSQTTANSNAAAGDTVYLRGGTYTLTSSSGCGSNYSCGIFPKNCGTSGNPITFAAYNGESPTFTTDGTAPTYTTGLTILEGGAGNGTYIHVTGITFHNLPNWASLYNYASYNQIDNCRFYSDTGEDFNGAAGLSLNGTCYPTTSSHNCYSRHNWIHNNIFSKAHEYGNQSCHEGGDIIRIGNGYPQTDSASNAADGKDSYNTIENNILEYAGHTMLDTYGSYNIIRNNTIHNDPWIIDYSNGACTYPPMPDGKYGHRGIQTSEDYARPAQYVLVEGNRLGFASANPNNPGEANLAIASPYTIVRYNYAYGGFQSGIGTKWYRAFSEGLSTTLSSAIGTSDTTIPVSSTSGLTVEPTRNYLLIENERIFCTGRTSSSFTGCTRGYLYTTIASHVQTTAVYANATANRGQSGTGPYKVRIYNNTTSYNGDSYPYMENYETGCSTCPGKLAGINVYSEARDVGVKNNLAYGNYSYTWQASNCSNHVGRDITIDGVSGCNDPASFPLAITSANNWETSSGDPLFTNPDVTNPTSQNLFSSYTGYARMPLPNLTLQSSSRAIDAGTYLTQANGSGTSSTSLVVSDAMYFQDGTWGSDLTRKAGTMQADWIAIGAVNNIVQISSINYSTNTITLASPISWNNNAPIWLYKKSDGARVLFGAAPDLGASEFETGKLLPPEKPYLVQ
jgi:hypothetical protein